MGDLVDFLKSLIVTTVQIDKKYRETVPDIITKMMSSIDTSDDGLKKRRRTKKMKLGKDGLYPFEDEYIREWWNTHKPDLKDDEANVPVRQIKSHAAMLCTRETQLQMILILEILALASLKTTNIEENMLPTLPGTTESQETMAPPPTRKRNKYNLPVLLDVHVDRLTIWQSTASDEQIILEDSQVMRHAGSDQTQQKASSEPLRDFCVDIIVPL